MSPRALIVCLASWVGGTAAAAPAYPVKLPNVSRKRIARLEADFRAKNPQTWDSVEVDPRGFVTRVITRDPALTPTLIATPQGPQWSATDFDRLREFLRTNAALFGVDPALIDQLKNAGAHLSVENRIGSAVLATIDVRYDTAPAPRLDLIVSASFPITPTLTRDDVKQRLVGQHYKQTISFGAAPELDCGLAPNRRGHRNCSSRKLFSEHHDVELTATDTHAHEILLRQGATYRLVACADRIPAPHVSPENVPPNMPDELMALENRLTPVRRSPKLPLIVDLVTGQVLPTRAAGCTEFEVAATRN